MEYAVSDDNMYIFILYGESEAMEDCSQPSKNCTTA